MQANRYIRDRSRRAVPAPTRRRNKRAGRGARDRHLQGAEGEVGGVVERAGSRGIQGALYGAEFRGGRGEERVSWGGEEGGRGGGEEGVGGWGGVVEV